MIFREAIPTAYPIPRKCEAGNISGHRTYEFPWLVPARVSRRNKWTRRFARYPVGRSRRYLASSGEFGTVPASALRQRVGSSVANDLRIFQGLAR